MDVRALLLASHSQHRAGRIADAVEGYRRVLVMHPAEAGTWHLIGTARLQAGRAAPAARAIYRALAAAPKSHEFRLNLGYALIDAGQPGDAFRALAIASRARPGDTEIWSARGAAGKRLGNKNATETSYRAAASLDPGAFAPLYNLGLARHEFGDAPGALRLYDRVGKIVPLSEAVLKNRAQALKALGRMDAACTNLRQAALIGPADAAVLNDLGILLWAAKRSGEAIAQYRRAAITAPEQAEIARNLTGALAGAGRYAEALDAYDAAIRQHPGDPGFPVRRALTLPVVAANLDQIEAARQKIAGFLAGAQAKKLRLEDPLRQLGAAHFYLAYHGRNDRTLAEGISRFYRLACPALGFTAPHCRDPQPPKDRVRLGICSKYLAGHTIGAVFGGLVTGLDRTRFRLTLLRPPGLRDAAAAAIAAGFDDVIDLPADIAAAARTAAECRLDALLYTDIGMEPFTYFLAHTRLAPVQWVTWGHPVTTGIDTIDAYLSPDCFEPDGADAHYSEHLVRSPSIPMVYRNESVPPPAEKSEFGLPCDRPLYLCPQNLFKLHPDYDHWFAGILESDPRGMLGLIEGANPDWTARLQARLAPVLGTAMERVRFLPYLPKNQYMRLLGAAEVMLDPIHFGGSNTTLGGFAAGTPVITWPGPFMRGRMTYGIYRTMGVTDCIARDREDYASKAVEIANDRAKRREIAAKIRDAQPTVVETAGAAIDLGNLMAEAVSSRTGSR